MTLYCRPIGSGGWALTLFIVEGARVSPMLVKIEDRFTIGDVTWRIVRIEA